MAFRVPQNYEGFFEESVRRFKLLLQKQVLTGIELSSLNRWLSNFRSDEEKYLAAHLLNSLIYRSEQMLCSSFQHLIHSELPTFLQKNTFKMPYGLGHFRDELVNASDEHSLRFVAVDGGFESTPGKSGATIIRTFRRHISINKKILCKPENIKSLPQNVHFLIFIDDILGTGKQFSKFVNHYELASLKDKFKMAYCPLVSYESGIKSLNAKYPWLTIMPIEQLNEKNQFFREKAGMPGIWHGDAHNSVSDVKQFFNTLAKRADIPQTNQYSLDLTVLFQHAGPNNTLSAYWASSTRWNPLIPR